jgi:hypothetical protein
MAGFHAGFGSMNCCAVQLFEVAPKMPRFQFCFIALVASVPLVIACSKSASQAVGAKAAPVAGNACDRKLLSAADVTGILHEPITGTKPLEGDPQSCDFVTATTESQGGPEIEVSLRPGLGRGTLKAWLDGSMGTTGSKLGGVGDDAVWVSQLKELDASKNDLLCAVSIGGSGVIDHYDDLAHKLSDVCNKIFARVAT